MSGVTMIDDDAATVGAIHTVQNTAGPTAPEAVVAADR